MAMTMASWIVIIDLLALLAAWLICRSAPIGYQDADGFHHGTPPYAESADMDRLFASAGLRSGHAGPSFGASPRTVG